MGPEPPAPRPPPLEPVDCRVTSPGSWRLSRLGPSITSRSPAAPGNARGCWRLLSAAADRTGRRAGYHLAWTGSSQPLAGPTSPPSRSRTRPIAMAAIPQRVADRLVDSRGVARRVRGTCGTFLLGDPDALCAVDHHFGRALHAAQDFYSHTLWTDRPLAPSEVSLDRPQGPGGTGPIPWLAPDNSGPPPPGRPSESGVTSSPASWPPTARPRAGPWPASCAPGPPPAAPRSFRSDVDRRRDRPRPAVIGRPGRASPQRPLDICKVFN